MEQKTPVSIDTSYRSIPKSVLIYMAWSNLSVRKLRTLLTVFGVTIGIGAIFFLMSLGLGLHNVVTQQVVGDKSIKSIEVSSPNSKILALDNNLAHKIRGLPHVTDIGEAYSYPGSLNYRGGSVDAVSYGINEAFARLDGLTPISGRLLKDTDSTSVVLNKAALKTIGISDATKAIGQSVEINVPLTNLNTLKPAMHNTFTIVGVVDFDSGSELFVPKGLFDVLQVPSYSQLKLSVDTTGQVDNTRHQIESLGYLTTSPIDTLNQINQIFKVFTAILIGFGGIGMIVSILGMFNTLTISLLERTKEIGLMKALGGRSSDMLKLFTYEASLISLIGAAAGVVLAMILGKFVDYIMNIFGRHRGVLQTFHLFSYPWWSVLGSILFMILVGLVVVQFPARRAERINPIDALRRE